ncbi:MAG TPA: MFS transporter [Rubrobacteraceae bacterium]|nr:MFS transporter [Rubrobacteraceae bacterium]
MNIRLFVLALGTFAIGTGSFVFAGLLEGVAEDLSVSVGAAGHLVTVFAVTYAVSSPVLATFTGAVSRRRLLIVSLTLFSVANALAVVAPTFELLLLCRVLAAGGAAAFTPTAAAVAASIAPPGGRGKALSIVTGGLTVSFVVGIPLGSVIGTYAGWRTTFVMVGVMGLAAVLGIRALLPDVEGPPPVSLRERVGVLKHPAIVAALGLTAFGMMGGFVAFTYISPLLGTLTGFGGGGVSGLLFLFGVAALFGNSLGGYGADNAGYGRLMAAILIVLSFSLLALSGLFVVAGSALAIAGVVAVLAAWGIAGFAINPLQQYRVIQLAPTQSNVALSLNASAIYLGQGVGASIGSLVLGHGTLATLGWTGAICSATALAVLFIGTRRPVPEAAAKG